MYEEFVSVLLGSERISENSFIVLAMVGAGRKVKKRALERPRRISSGEA